MIFYIETINGNVETANFITSPAEALVIFRALDDLVNDEDANDYDKQLAERLVKEMTRIAERSVKEMTKGHEWRK